MDRDCWMVRWLTVGGKSGGKKQYRLHKDIKDSSLLHMTYVGT